MDTDLGIEKDNLANNQEENTTGTVVNGNGPSEKKASQKKKSELSTELIHATKNVVKLYESITNHDELSSNQRNIVRQLIDQQAAALDRKLNGQPVGEGGSFDDLSKQLRKENNRLDALLEGKETLFKKYHEAHNALDLALNAIRIDIKKQEDES